MPMRGSFALLRMTTKNEQRRTQRSLRKNAKVAEGDWKRSDGCAVLFFSGGVVFGGVGAGVGDVEAAVFAADEFDAVGGVGAE
jgi:hypothetical protein